MMTGQTNDEDRRQRNGHTVILDGCMWRCIQCHHWFDALADANLFWCGDDCTGKHPGDVHRLSAVYEVQS